MTTKFSKSLLVASSIVASFSAQAATHPFKTDSVTGYVTAATDIKQQAKDAIAKGNIDVPKILIDSVNVSALQNVINDVKSINLTMIKPQLISIVQTANPLGIPIGTTLTSQQVQQLNSIQGGSNTFHSSFGSSSLAGALNGHLVNVYTLGGAALNNNALGGNLGFVDAVTGGKVTKYTDQIKLKAPLSDTVMLMVDGQKVIDSTQTVSREDVLGLLRTLEILPALNTASSTILGPMSPSGLSSQIVYDKLTPKLRSRKEVAAVRMRPDTGNPFIVDLKFEQVQFKGTEKGSIQGILMNMSTDIAGVEVGAYIPYDYLSFKSFDAHRTGGVIYAKHDLQLPMNLTLSSMANFNGIATYIPDFSVTGTVGGGIGTTLTYDDDGDFVPQASFSFQYNRDYYPVVGKYIKDNEQYLVKMGTSLGYRVFENGTINAGFTYTRDITDYVSKFNKIKDNDYFDLSISGSYAIADTWSVNLAYKRILM